MKKRKYLLYGGCAAAVPVISALCVRFVHMAAAEVILTDIFLLIALGVWLLSDMLRISLRRTLYSYTNIALVGGILFLMIMDAFLLPVLLSVLGKTALTLGSIYRLMISFPKKFSYYALFFIVALSLLLAVSNIALMRHEGICLHNVLSLLVALFYIGGTGLVYFVSELLTTRVFSVSPSPAVRVCGTVIPLFLLLLLCYFECILVGTGVMGYLAAHEKPRYDKDFIIILGCSIDRRGGLLPLLKGRVNRAIRFAWQQEIDTGKSVLYVPSGGKGADEIMSEGSAMELYLLSHGAEDDEVFPEKQSVSTYENMLFSKKIIDGIKPDAKIAFATTNYHMLRSGILARKAGIDAQGVAGDTKWYFWPNGFIREFFAILTMNVKTHISFAAVTAAACLGVGIVEYILQKSFLF